VDLNGDLDAKLGCHLAEAPKLVGGPLEVGLAGGAAGALRDLLGPPARMQTADRPTSASSSPKSRAPCSSTCVAVAAISTPSNPNDLTSFRYAARCSFGGISPNTSR
jgi:hypothetical protein